MNDVLVGQHRHIVDECPFRVDIEDGRRVSSRVAVIEQTVAHNHQLMLLYNESNQQQHQVIINKLEALSQTISSINHIAEENKETLVELQSWGKGVWQVISLGGAVIAFIVGVGLSIYNWFK